MHKLTLSILVLLLVPSLTSCGGEDLFTGQFTSQVVQRNTCRVTGEGNETCVQDEQTFLLRLSLVEDDEARVWLIGISRDGEDDRRILGTRDSLGGYLFYDELSQRNTVSGCRLDEELTLVLKIDEEALPDSIGVDPCVALVGREIRTTRTSPQCDDLNTPPQQVTRIVRRRWETPTLCTADLTN